VLIGVARHQQVLRHPLGRQRNEAAAPSRRRGDAFRPFELRKTFWFADVVHAASRAVVDRGQRNRRGDVLDEAARTFPARVFFLEQDRGAPIVDAFHDGLESPQRIARAVHHRQAQHRPG